jgi:catechol 2,3-dioxygenase-like lactoylglutathione lyase family enzyme
MTIDTALDRYDSGRLTRRELLQALVVAGVVQPGTAGSIFKGRELNHVTLGVKDVQRSREFYARVLGLPVLRTLDTPYREVQFQFENSFLSLAQGYGRIGQIDHFCVGIDGFELHNTAAKLQAAGLKPLLESDGKWVYIEDPDGIRVQVAATGYRG